MIEHHLLKLSSAGFRQVVINTAYLGDRIQQYLGDGAKFGLTIHYSDESSTGALETAGGLRHALDLIKSDPFVVINADIYTDFDFTKLLTPFSTDKKCLGRIVLVPNPPHNPEGDFPTRAGDRNNNTFSGIALYKKSIFTELDRGKQALGPLLKNMVASRQLGLIDHHGKWTDVGTPERLAQVNSEITDAR